MEQNESNVTVEDVELVLQRLASTAASAGVQFSDPAAAMTGDELIQRWHGVVQSLQLGQGQCLTAEGVADLQKIYDYTEAIIIGCGSPDAFDVYEVCFEALMKVDALVHHVAPPELLIGLLESINEIYDVLLSCIETFEWVQAGATGLLRLYMLQVAFSCFGYQNVTGRVLMELTSNDISGTVGLVAFVLRCSEASFDLQSTAARCLVDLTAADSVFFTDEVQGNVADYQTQNIQKLTGMLNRHINGLIKSVIQFDIVDSFGHCICQHQQSHIRTDIIVKYFLTTIHNCLLYCSENQQKMRQHLAIQSTVVRDIMLPYVDNLLPALLNHQNPSPAALEWQTLKSALQTFVVVTFNIFFFVPQLRSSEMMLQVMEVPGILQNLPMLELILKISANVDPTQSQHKDVWLGKLVPAISMLDAVSMMRLRKRMCDNQHSLPYNKLALQAIPELAIVCQENEEGVPVQEEEAEFAPAQPPEMAKKLQHNVQEEEFGIIAQQQVFAQEQVFAQAPADPVGQPAIYQQSSGSLLGDLPSLATGSPKANKKKEKNKIRITSRSHIEAPEEMRCQIDGKVAINPVRSPYGHLFEKKTLEKWLMNCGSVCPKTEQPLRLQDCVPDVEMKKAIVKFLKGLEA